MNREKAQTIIEKEEIWKDLKLENGDRIGKVIADPKGKFTTVFEIVDKDGNRKNGVLKFSAGKLYEIDALNEVLNDLENGAYDDELHIVRPIGVAVDTYEEYYIIHMRWEHVVSKSDSVIRELFSQRDETKNDIAALRLALEITIALQFFHKRGYVHRDVKPNNLFYHYRADGEITFLLGDFDVCRKKEYPDSSTPTWVYSNGYCPGEWKGKVIPCRDIYALGATLYCLLSEEKSGKTIEERLNSLPTEFLKNPLNREWFVPPDHGTPELHKIIERMMTPNEGLNYPNIESLKKELLPLYQKRKIESDEALRKAEEEKRRAEEEIVRLAEGKRKTDELLKKTEEKGKRTNEEIVRLAEEKRRAEEREKKATEEIERLAAEKRKTEERPKKKRKKKRRKIKSEKKSLISAFSHTFAGILSGIPLVVPILIITLFACVVGFEMFVYFTGFESSKQLKNEMLNGENYTVVFQNNSELSTSYKSELLRNANIGDVVYFGAYEQDNDTENGEEAIEWIVLDKKDNKLFLLSKYALDCQQYHSKSSGITWENCTLRNWLNTEFLETAFTGEEAVSIASTTVTADNNYQYYTYPGNNTQDKIFLLSMSEAEWYFNSNQARLCTPTLYAVSQSPSSVLHFLAFVSDKYVCTWWLRTPGCRTSWVAQGGFSGGVDFNGYRASTSIGVRPALWLQI